ncbi:hypothetical protein SUDANB99_05947 (plasmid) [Streptomyces sp. enrichment culture]
MRSLSPADWPDRYPERGLHANVGISLRRPGQSTVLLGNQAGILRFALPCGDPNPLGRLRRIQSQLPPTRIADLAQRHRVLFQNLPYWCGKLGLRHSLDPRYTPLSVADVRIRRSLRFADATARHAFPIPITVPGQPLFIAWTAHRGTLHTTFLADAALPSLERLPTLWQSAAQNLVLASQATPEDPRFCRQMSRPHQE